MRRGESVAEGCVKFPFDSKEYSERAGRGLVVKLVVLDQVEGMCCATYVGDILNNILIGDDKRPTPEDKPLTTEDPDAILEHMTAEQNAHNEWVGFHYPRHDEEDKTVGSMISRSYRASIVLGSTGWAGFSMEKGNWYATFDDLTPDGQELYRVLERLNPGCALHILTFLDT